MALDTEDSKPEGPAQYGRSFYCIGLSDGTEVSAHADRIDITDTGALLLLGGFSPRWDRPEDVTVTLTFAAGQWVYA